MKVTGFDLRNSNAGGNSIAFGKIIVDNLFEVEVTIMKGKNGLFLSYPSKKNKDGKWFSSFKFLDREISDKVQDQVIFWYEQNLKGLNA